MLYILVGTDRPQSRSLAVAKIIEPFYANCGFQTKIMKLEDLDLQDLNGSHYAGAKPPKIQKAIDDLMVAEGIVIVCPEYNGSYPGVLKLFIDHWKYPESFERRPICYVGLGGRFGALRPIEHLQQVFGYRNAFNFPDRVFIQNVWESVKENAITIPAIEELLQKQAQGFCRFIKALRSEFKV